MSSPRNFPAKLLLFGEHAVLLGGEALALPLNHYQAYWSPQPADGPELQNFLDWLISQRFPFLDLNSLEKGLPYGAQSIASTIPQGYGLGSSGAVTALVYDWLVNDPAADEKTLQQRLASMESFFHGNSSGTDPLVSYLNRPVWLNHGVGPEFPDLPVQGLKHWYLVDSHQPRSAGTTIKRFANEFGPESGMVNERQVLFGLNKAAIESFLAGQESQLTSTLKALSAWQWEHMRYMIPEQLQPLWLDGLENGAWTMKICGAGGGGFLLLRSENPPVNYPLIALGH